MMRLLRQIIREELSKMSSARDIADELNRRFDSEPDFDLKGELDKLPKELKDQVVKELESDSSPMPWLPDENPLDGRLRLEKDPRYSDLSWR